MIAKIARPVTGAGMLRVLRRMASELVEREEYRCRSRMVAYENIGGMVGASGSWVRNLVNGYGTSNDLSFTPTFNLMQLYDRLCAGIEAENEKDERDILSLRREAHEAYPRTLSQVLAVDQIAESAPEAQPVHAERMAPDDED